jgi:phosphoribosylanthranilate isomerase
VIVKVCGVRTAAIAECAVDAGADWVGVVLEPRSPRHAGDAEVEAVWRALAGRADLVGVMVEPPAERCRALTRRHRLDAVQLHGRVDPTVVGDVDVTVIRGVNPAGPGDAFITEWWPDGLLLLDSPPRTGRALPGGTGVSIDLETAAEVAAHRLIILAGGLTPDTVAAAIERVRPYGVDASSGLESSPGVKDPGRVRDFVVAAREAFATVEACRKLAAHAAGPQGGRR